MLFIVFVRYVNIAQQRTKEGDQMPRKGNWVFVTRLFFCFVPFKGKWSKSFLKKHQNQNGLFFLIPHWIVPYFNVLHIWTIISYLALFPPFAVCLCCFETVRLHLISSSSSLTLIGPLLLELSLIVEYLSSLFSLFGLPIRCIQLDCYLSFTFLCALYLCDVF